MICELTGLPVSNASLLDEASCAGETLYIALNFHDMKRKRFFVQDTVFPQVLSVIRTKAHHLNVEILVGDPAHLKDEELTTLAGAYF
jgi:glycine dehydrogenase